MLRTLVFACLLAASPLCFSQSFQDLPNAIQSTALKVEVLDGDEPMSLPAVRGYRRAISATGKPYALRLTNRTEERIWVVVSIDAINPATGKRATQGQRGLVIDPGKTRIVNQQKNDLGVGPLAFNTKTLDAPGKIGFAVFRERMDYPHLLPWTPALEARVGGSIRVNEKTRAKVWIPPSGAPFRKIGTDPQERLYFEYHTTE